jgi:hypothetical protein
MAEMRSLHRFGILAVRAGPGSGYVMLDTVYNDDYLLNICDMRGKWLGVVYSHETEDCGVSTTWTHPAAYTGPCVFGLGLPGLR